ncbi:MAG: archease [Candidatus Nanohaloarchaea archaeon]|nr:archease [Candidatus Nanohaloarchaea archaeon]
MSSFELLEHTSEVGFRATGGTLEDAFEQAGRAVFQVMTDIGDIDAAREIEITVESESMEALLYDFVDELVYLASAEDIVLSRFDLDIETGPQRFRLTGVGRGETIRPEMRRQEVKAPTYSDMAIERNDEWTLTMFLDV